MNFTVCVSISKCTYVCVRLSCAHAQWPFLPALFKPKLHGAAYGKGIYLSPISSISFGYSGRNGSSPFRPLCPHPHPPCFFHHVHRVAFVFATWPNWHRGTLHFHLWVPAMLSCCAVLCFHFWVLGLGPLSFCATCHAMLHVVAV